MSKISTNIFTLFIAYTTQEISEKQFQTLQHWINQNPENKRQFEEYLIFYKKARRVGLTKNLHKESAWDNIISQLEQPLIVKKEKTIIKLYWKYAVAASILLLIALTIFVNQQNESPEFGVPVIINNNIKPGINKAILTLEDGSEVSLKKGQLYQEQNIQSNGEEIIYEDKNTQEIVYNYLTIPRGGQYQLTLTDGTKVWLNSETKLKYPVNFNNGKNRKVELIYGEAYFDVSSSKENGDSKFIVSHQLQDIEVLGTEFNIKAYSDEMNIYTTLVEGKVSVLIENNKRLLEPNQLLNFDLVKGSISTSFVDVYNEVSWKEGIFSFKNKSLKDIMQVLSRWYDIDVTFTDKKLENIGFDGVVGKEQNIEEILMTIKNFGIIKNYEINNKSVTLK